ncbi:MAG: translation elongation factor Ts [Candidatus Levybacteria bacterium]|nr:translation elongation factor Ts [Candidatus Levybacteria bacterium]
MTIDLNDLKRLRAETSASVSDCRQALEEADGDYAKALTWIKKHSIAKAGKKSDRKTTQGIIESYIHGNRKVGVLLELFCETDFVAKTDEFKQLAHELAMQIAAMDPNDVATLLKQEYIRDGSLTVGDIISGVIGKLGENITVGRFARFAM